MIDLHFNPDEVAPIRRQGIRVTTLMIGVLVVGGSVGMFVRTVDQAREAARASQCLGVSQIALALHNYHDFYGSLPPAYVADADGKPMHSWRVLLLPFLSFEPLYKTYNMAEPWDSPNNRKLLDLRPNVFHCPSRDCGSTLTSYVAIVGPKTAFPGSGTTRFDQIRDPMDQTILIAEVSNVDIPWTEPRDLDTATMSWLINDPSKPSISSPHGPRRGPAVIYAKQMARRLHPDTPPATVKAMTTIDGHEPVDRKDLP